MIKQILTTLILSLTLFSSFNTIQVFADDNIQSEEVSTSTKEEYLPKKFNEIKINYILNGVETALKSSKIINNESYFWDDYTIKLSNNLMFSSIDIQKTIRGYHFSHYEINGRRIESIDALITVLEPNCEINVVYSEESHNDGYLRKGFRSGIALDFDYLKYASSNNKTLETELYDDTWSIKISTELANEIIKDIKDSVNANDKTIYLNVNTSPISTKEKDTITKKYNLIDCIKISTSLGYKDYIEPLTLKYSFNSDFQEYLNNEITLYGVNLEGKIEKLSSSTINEKIVSFDINKSLNKYQFFFIASNNKETITSDISNTSQNNSTQDNNIKDKEEVIENTIINDTTTEIKDNSRKNNESKIVALAFIFFSLGSIFTFLLAFIISTRNANIEKKKLKENGDNK